MANIIYEHNGDDVVMYESTKASIEKSLLTIKDELDATVSKIKITINSNHGSITTMYTPAKFGEDLNPLIQKTIGNREA